MASAPHVADLAKGSPNAKILLNLTDAEVQVAVPVSEHWGITANGLYGFTGQYMGELGAVYFINGAYRYFEVSAGIGVAHINSEVGRVPGSPFAIPGLSEFAYFHTIKSDYIKLYVQPSFIFKVSEKFRMGPTLKIAPLLFTRYEYDYRLSFAGGLGNGGDKEVDFISFQNKFGINAEPVVNLKWTRNRANRGFLKIFEPTLILQIGGSFTSTVMKSEVFQATYENIPAHLQEFKHPKQNNFILNLGLELNW